MEEDSLENHQSQSSWTPPPTSTLKLNVDAFWSRASGIGGVGWTIRDSKGSLVLAVQVLEAIAVHIGFNLVDKDL